MLGSLARGDDADGSDVDLWVLADRDATVHTTIRRVAVTIMYETWERASDPGHWLRVEIGSAQVLVDRGGRFAKLKRRFARARGRVQAQIVEATNREVSFWLRKSQRGTLRERLSALRHAAIRVVCLPVFIASGVRDPRFRHLRAFYDPDELALVRRALGLERRPPRLQAKVRGLPSAAAKLRALEWEEAVLNARLHGRWVERPPRSAYERQARDAIASLRRRAAAPSR